MDVTVNLSRREDQVAELIVWGAASKQVADLLFISEETVSNHKKNIYKKIGAKCVAQLCAWWFCKKFNIPISLSPIPLIAFFFISLTIANRLHQNYRQNIVRTASVYRLKRIDNYC